MTKEEAAVQFYFHMTAGALILVIVATLVGVLIASHVSQNKLIARVDRILATPIDQVTVWVHKSVSSYDLGEYDEYTLFAEFEGGERLKLTDNDDRAKWVCNVLTKAGRPAHSVPAAWLKKV